MKTRLIRKLVTTSAVALAGSLLAVSALAQQTQPRAQAEVQQQARAQERIYGEDLMTPQERNTYRERMNTLETDQERAAYRKAHAQQMQSRAAERGVTLPEQAAQTRPGEARQGPAPSGRSQTPPAEARERDTRKEMQRNRDMHEQMMRDSPSQGGRKPHGNRR